MRRRALLFSTLLPFALRAQPRSPGPAPAVQAAPLTDRDRADLARIEAYLNGLRTLKARFIQVAPDRRTTAGGTAWLQRPGRMRFQYDPPSPLLLVAGGGLVVFNDSQLKQTTNIPIGQTPLGLLLQDHLRLSGDVTVVGMAHPPGRIEVTLVRTASPGDGSLTLVFSDQPLQLVEWTVTDAQRQQTTVRLYDVQVGGSFDQSLFHFVDPNFFGNNPGGGG